MNDPLITKSSANLCAGVAQYAANIISAMMSAYWSATTNQKIPVVFIKQASDYTKEITNLLELLQAKATSDEAKS